MPSLHRHNLQGTPHPELEAGLLLLFLLATQSSPPLPRRSVPPPTGSTKDYPAAPHIPLDHLVPTLDPAPLIQSPTDRLDPKGWYTPFLESCTNHATRPHPLQENTVLLPSPGPIGCPDVVLCPRMAVAPEPDSTANCIESGCAFPDWPPPGELCLV